MIDWLREMVPDESARYAATAAAGWAAGTAGILATRLALALAGAARIKISAALARRREARETARMKRFRADLHMFQADLRLTGEAEAPPVVQVGTEKLNPAPAEPRTAAWGWKDRLAAAAAKGYDRLPCPECGQLTVRSTPGSSGQRHCKCETCGAEWLAGK